MTERLAVPEDLRQRWAAVALTVRTVDRIIGRVREPQAGSAFMMVEIAFPSESITQWSLAGLSSATDHMLRWADHSLPMQWSSDHVVETKGYRWIYTLIRGALEGTAQSLWLTGSTYEQEAVARMLRMVRHDLDEQAKAWRVMGRDSAQIVARENALAPIAELLKEHGSSVGKLPAMVDLVRMAGEAIGEDPDRYESAWRVCSAAAHGKSWAVGELTVQRIVREWRPGHFQTDTTADPQQLTTALEAAGSLLNAAAGRYLARCGHDQVDYFLRAAVEVAREMPQKDGGAGLSAFAKERGYEES